MPGIDAAPWLQQVVLGGPALRGLEARLAWSRATRRRSRRRAGSGNIHHPQRAASSPDALETEPPMRSFAAALALLMPALGAAHQLSDFVLLDPALSIHQIADLNCVTGPSRGATVLADGSMLVVRPLDPDFNQMRLTRVTTAGAELAVVDYPRFGFNPHPPGEGYNCDTFDVDLVNGEIAVMCTVYVGCPDRWTQIFRISGLPKLRLPGPPNGHP